MNDLSVSNLMPKNINDKDLSYTEKVAVIVQTLQKMDQVECPVKHHFAPGVYLREIFMPAGTIVIGKIHRTEHFNIVVSGLCSIVHEDGRHEYLRGPMTFVSKAGVQKLLFIHEDTIWKTVHPTDETSVEVLEQILIEPPPIVMLDEHKKPLAELENDK